MSNADYNEAQFEIEKAEAVKEARNAALEEAAKMFDSDAETATRLLAFNPDFCLVVKGIATQSAVRIRALKTLAILLPLLFVFGVAAGEPVYVARAGESAESAALGQAALSAAYEHRDLKVKWTRRRAFLNAEEQAQLNKDLAEAKARMDSLTTAHAAVRPQKVRP